MPATTGYQAGTESNAVLLSYGVETAWATLPAVAFQAIRHTSESLAFPKTRARPGEIPTNREAIAAVTTQQAVSGAINFALSYGTYDDFLSVMLGNDWGTAQTIAGIAADITLTSGTPAVLSSTLATKFQNIVAGQWIRLLGFTTTANNDFYYVATKTDNSHLSLNKAGTAAAVTETPTGTNAQVRAKTIQNGSQFKSLYLQKQFSSALFLQYPGAFVTGATLSGGVGQFLSGSFNVAAQQELSATTDASTGTVVAAPTGRAHDPVGGFRYALLNETAMGTLQKFSLSIQNTGAASEYGMGSPSAAGMLQGVLDVSGTMDMYFKDFTLYAKFIAETAGRLEFITADVAGNAYAITLPNANIFASINAGGPNQPVMASFKIEGNPQSAGGTIQFDKLPAT